MRISAPRHCCKLYVEDMPLVVIIDSEGNNLYEEGRAEYLAEHKAHERKRTLSCKNNRSGTMG